MEIKKILDMTNKEDVLAGGWTKDKYHRDQVTASFLDYLQKHPDERWFQALRNWLNVGFVYISSKPADGKFQMQDTFYLEDKDLLERVNQASQ